MPVTQTVSLRPIVAHQAQRSHSRLNEGHGKLHLKLRQMDFSKELEALPMGQDALLELLLHARTRTNGGIYDTVAAWNKLREQGSYWKPTFRSESRFLAHYCIQDGTTLGHWTAMVKLFDQQTFVLLGADVIGHMMERVKNYQDQPLEQRKDYEAIFARYAREHVAFTRSAFYAIIHDHVRRRYEEPMAVQAGLSIDDWLRSRSKRKTAGANPKMVIRDCAAHIRALESLLSQNGIEIPEKPESLTAIPEFQ